VARPERDESLARRFADGESAAFEELVHRHETRVYNLCLRMLGSPEDARDATQEAFFAVFRKISSFRGDAAFTTWLHRIALNACYDALRRRRRDPVGDLPENEPDTHSVDPAERAADVVDVQRALMLVPEDFRSVLIMHDVQDMPYDQLSEVLGVPTGTVKSRLHRGRLALADLLSGTDERARASEERMQP